MQEVDGNHEWGEEKYRELSQCLLNFSVHLKLKPISIFLKIFDKVKKYFTALSGLYKSAHWHDFIGLYSQG